MVDSIDFSHVNQSKNKSWSIDEVMQLFTMPFFDLIYRARGVFLSKFDPQEVEVCSLLSIKTGSCPENCSYCPQSAHYNTNLKKEPLMKLEQVRDGAKKAKESGATRFCMGAAWRGVHDRDVDLLCSMIKEVKDMGLETCASFGLLSYEQACALKKAGLDFYNHNIDCSEGFYSKIITTRNFQDRLATLANVRRAGINVCSGGIVGMGESVEDRAMMLMTLANLEEYPASITINKLIPIAGTPLENVQPVDSFDFVKVIAVARVMMPNAYVRISAGRESMSEEMQALCLFAGANSIFYGEKLLTASNSSPSRDDALLKKLSLIPKKSAAHADVCCS